MEKRSFFRISHGTGANHDYFQADGMETDLFNHEPHERHEKTRFSSGSWLKWRLGFCCVGFLPGVFLLMGLGGCATSPDYEKFTTTSLYKSGTFFMEHPCPLVQVPSTLAVAPAGAVGLCDYVAVMLIGGAISGVTSDFYPPEKLEWIWWGCVPPVMVQYASAHVVGVPCWGLFGWWWPEKYNMKTGGSQKTEESEISESLESPKETQKEKKRGTY
jgi:hypothetical protein